MLLTARARVARHRVVYDSLQHFIDQGLHALAIEVLEQRLRDSPTAVGEDQPLTLFLGSSA